MKDETPSSITYQQQHNNDHNLPDHQDNKTQNNSINTNGSLLSTPPRTIIPSRDYTPDRNYTSNRNYTDSRNYTSKRNYTASRNDTSSYYSSTNSSPQSSYRSSQIISDIHDNLHFSNGSTVHRPSSINNTSVSTSNNSYESTLAVAKASARFKHIYSTTTPSQSIALNDKLNNSTTASSIDYSPIFEDRFHNIWSRYKQETGTSVDTLISNNSSARRRHRHHPSNPHHISNNSDNHDQHLHNANNILHVEERNHKVRNDSHEESDIYPNNDEDLIDRSNIPSVNINNSTANDDNNNNINNNNVDHHHHHQDTFNNDCSPSVSIDAYNSTAPITVFSPDAQEIYADIGKLSEKIDTKLKSSS